MGQDAYGKPVYGAGAAVQARWQGKLQLVRDKTGKEVVSQSQVWLEEAVEVEDKLAYGGREYTVLAVADAVGLNGQIDHRVAYL